MRSLLVALAGLAVIGAAAVAPANAASERNERTATQARASGKVSVQEGYGGAVSTVDHDATKAGISVLRNGGNAVDAAVAAAAALGVTEPFSNGIGGGGFFVYYDAGTGKVHTLDGRETAPSSADAKLFIDPETGNPLSFDEARYSGLSVGAPGTPQVWSTAVGNWGTWSFGETLRPAIRLAKDGFTVDETYAGQIEDNADWFDDFTSTRELFLPGGSVPKVGSKFRNPDLARTYGILAKQGVSALYGGQLGEEYANAVQAPPVASDADHEIRSGDLTADDVADYTVKERAPTTVDYRGLEVASMAPPSSGGSTVGEALNILENFDLSADDKTAALHNYLEASSLAFADRNRYVGDPDFVDVPLEELLSLGFADERACEIAPGSVLPRPIAPGRPDGDYGDCGSTAPAGSVRQDEGLSTTHLTVADKFGNVVSYTLTIESTGGSGIVVPDRGYLLNNELTDFSFAPTQGDAPDPNLPGPTKRPRSSMSPTIVLADGKPVLAVGTPGGSTIITTVLQILVNRYDLGMDLPEALAAPRASSRNTSAYAEPAFLESPEGKALLALGHKLPAEEEIGAATGIEFLGDGRMQAVAEPERRGGGSAKVVIPVTLGS